MREAAGRAIVAAGWTGPASTQVLTNQRNEFARRYATSELGRDELVSAVAALVTQAPHVVRYHPALRDSATLATFRAVPTSQLHALLDGVAS